MGFIIFLLLLAIIYVGAGFLVTYTKAQSNDNVFDTDWEKILTWPKDVFGK